MTSTAAFVALTFLLSIPFWLLGAADLGLPVKLPVSSLIVVCPLIAALLLSRRGARKRLLARLIDRAWSQHKIWYAVSVILVPGLLLISYLVMNLMGRPVPKFAVSPLDLLILAIAFLVAAAAEEVGWTGFATDPLMRRWGALATGLLLGFLWGLWHAVGWYLHLGHSIGWTAGQWAATISLRVLIVWVYANTGPAILAAVCCHASANLGQFLFPQYGSHYDPVLHALMSSAAVVIISVLWDTRTFHRRRPFASWLSSS